MAALATPPPAAHATSTPAAEPTSFAGIMAQAPGLDPTEAPPVENLEAPVDPAPEVPAVDPSAPAIDPTDPNAEVPVVDPAAIEPPPDAPITDADMAEEIAPDSVSQDGRRHFYSATKSQKLQAANKLVRELGEVMPVVSKDAIVESIKKANSADYMMNLFHQGSAEAADQMLGLFQQENPAAYGVLAIRALNALPKVNPEAARAIESHQRNTLIQQERSWIAQISDPAQRDHQIAFVQNLENQWTGRFTPKAELLQGQNVDPAQAERADLNRQLNEIQQFKQQQAQAQATAKMTAINSAETAGIDSVIDGALAPIKDKFSADDVKFMRAQLLTSLGELESSHPEWATKYQNLRMQAETTGRPEHIAQLVEFRKGIATQAVRQNSQRIVNSRTGPIVAANQAALQRANNPRPNEPAPNGTVTAPPNAVDQALKSTSWKEMFAVGRTIR